MIALAIALLLLTVLTALFAYVEALYRERERFLARQHPAHLEAFEAQVLPRLGPRAAVTASLGAHLGLALIAMGLAAWSLLYAGGGAEAWLEAALLLIAAMVLTTRWIPALLLARTSGRWLHAWLPVLHLGDWILWPVSSLLGFGASLASLSQEPIPAQDPEEKRESEIEALMEAGTEEGIIEEHERELVQSALEFGDKRIREIMVPRPDIVAIPAHATLRELKEKVRERHLRRLPVYNGDIDHIVGMVATRELFRIDQSEELDRHQVSEFLQPVLFIPEAATSADLLREMQLRGLHTAIVVNEYGAVAGLITFGDLLEELVGEMPEAHGLNPSPEWRELGPGEFEVAGSLELERLGELIHHSLESREAASVGGYLAEHLGRIPLPEETLSIDGLEFKIVAANDVRILKVRVHALNAGEEKLA